MSSPAFMQSYGTYSDIDSFKQSRARVSPSPTYLEEKRKDSWVFSSFVLIRREGKNNACLMQSKRQHIHSHITHALFEPKDSFSSLMNYINSKLFTQLSNNLLFYNHMYIDVSHDGLTFFFRKELHHKLNVSQFSTLKFQIKISGRRINLVNY